MQILIAHRGNINGKYPDRENSPEYLMEAISKGYSVEADVWASQNELFLGHDKIQYKTTIDFLKNDKIWCHCKNIEALKILLENNIHCFFHQQDDVTLTSQGYIWTFPRKRLLPGSVCVMPEYGYDGDLSKCLGICSDIVEQYK
tara:strand:- start:31638 stop:32069 length:432 start_codon:yes stop_codon:yes gene_type:complete